MLWNNLKKEHRKLAYLSNIGLRYSQNYSMYCNVIYRIVVAHPLVV